MKKSIPILILIMAALFLASEVTLAQAQFVNGKLGLQVNSYGRVRIYSPGVIDTADAHANDQIDRFSILVSGKSGEVFDYYNDLNILSGPELIASPKQSDFEITFTGDNSYNDPPLPPSVKEELTVYGWNDVNYLIIKTTITNLETGSLAAHIGGEILPWNGTETDAFDAASGILSTRTPSYPFIGFKELSQNVESTKYIDWFDGYNASDTDLYNWLVTGSIQSTYTTASADGTVLFYSGPVVNMEPNGSKVLWTAIALGTTMDEMKTNMNAAVAKYNSTFTDVQKINDLPNSFELSQNYPNPFNPNTTINFGISKSEFVNLSVYNLLGQKVEELINHNLNAGNYSAQFNAKSLASGIYIYKLSTSTQSIMKKMTLLK